MKASDDKLFKCEQQAITNEEMRLVDEWLSLEHELRERPIETKAMADAKQAEFWNRVRKVLTLIAIAIVAYTLFNFT